MRQHLCCLTFVIICLAVVLVKSEKFTEVDENGNEIEVKRFYIEGRQVNGGNRQCVETRRRKRSSSYGESDENVAIASLTAPTGIDTADTIDEDDVDANVDQSVAVFGVFNKGDKIKGQTVILPNAAEEDEDGESEESAVLSLPVVAHLTHENGAQSTVGAAASGGNGVVIVHANKPPKVNPQTHAVFELRPVDSGKLGGDDLADTDDDYDDLAYEEEVNPVSTTAIWSTGDEDTAPYNHVENDYEDSLDKDEDGDMDEQKPIGKPTKKPTKKPSRKPTKRPNKKRPTMQRPNKSHNKRGQSGNKEHIKRRKQGAGYRKTANRRKNQNLHNRDIKDHHLNKLHNVNQGSDSFTKTETLTKTGTANDQKDVNCIIINRTTTARPFWGLFGRSADGEEVPVDKPYGRRKRINFSIPA